MGPALRTIVSAALRSVALIAFVVVLILVLLPAALAKLGGRRRVSSGFGPAGGRATAPMTDRHDLVWARRETGECLRNARGTGARLASIP